MALTVTLLTTSLDYGGAEKQVVCLAQAFKQRALDVDVISMLEPVAYSDELAASGIPVTSLAMRRGVANPLAVIKLARILNQHRPDVLHSHMVNANLLARVTGLVSRPSVVISTAHNINEGPRWRELAYRVTDRFADLTTNVSIAGVERYTNVKAVPARKIMFMPNGVEPFTPVLNARSRERFRSSLGCESHWTWLAVGNLRKAKDYPTLLQAVAQLPEDSSDVRVLIVGSGEEQERLERLRDDLRLRDRVHFLGTRRDVSKLLEIADAFVMSSAWEGLPLALIEASLAAVPIVATDVGGNCEIVKHGLTGLLVPSGSPSLLRDAMLAVQKMSVESRTAMGNSGREFAAANFSMPKIADRWIELYSSLLQGRSRAREAPARVDRTNSAGPC